MNDFHQGLLDCGCLQEQCAEYDTLTTSGERMRFLKERRQVIMENLHEAQRQVDCVDFLIREVRREQRGPR